MKRAFLLLVVLAILAACSGGDSPAYPPAEYPYVITTDLLILFCRRFNSEERIAFDCWASHRQPAFYAEYPLDMSDTWKKR